jgi:hypothetical protein
LQSVQIGSGNRARSSVGFVCAVFETGVTGLQGHTAAFIASDDENLAAMCERLSEAFGERPPSLGSSPHLRVIEQQVSAGGAVKPA